MLMKIFNSDGEVAGAFNYLLGNNRDREHATVLFGEPNFTKQIAESLSFKQKHLVGCLAFEESADDFSEKQKKDIMMLFEKTFFCGFESDQFDICWIQHNDKYASNASPEDKEKSGRLELNFVIPRVELRSGNAFNPYLHKVDKNRKEVFQEIVNIKYNLTRPDDPTKMRMFNSYASKKPRPKTLPVEQTKNNKSEDIKLTRYDIEHEILEKMRQIHEESPFISEQVVDEQLEKLNVFGKKIQVVKKGKDFTSISHPLFKQNIRLRGAVFRKDFKFIQKRIYGENGFYIRSSDEQNEIENQKYERAKPQRLQELEETLKQMIEKRAEYIKIRYKSVMGDDSNFNEVDFSIDELNELNNDSVSNTSQKNQIRMKI